MARGLKKPTSLVLPLSSSSSDSSFSSPAGIGIPLACSSFLTVVQEREEAEEMASRLEEVEDKLREAEEEINAKEKELEEVNKTRIGGQNEIDLALSIGEVRGAEEAEGHDLSGERVGQQGHSIDVTQGAAFT